MTEVRTRDEAFAAIDAGLARWAVAAADLLARATATASGVQAEAEAEAVHRSRRVTELADLLAALQPEDKLRPVVAANRPAPRNPWQRRSGREPGSLTSPPGPPDCSGPRS